MNPSHRADEIDGAGARVRIERAYRRAMERWELRPSSAKVLAKACSRFAHVALTYDVPEMMANRSVGRRYTKKKLDQIARLAVTLAEKVEDLPEPAVLALERVGPTRAEIGGWLQQLANVAHAVDVAALTGVSKRKRPTKKFAATIAAHVVDDFEGMTGARADLPGSRGLVPLIREVFDVLGVGADAKAAYEAVLRARDRARSRAPSTD